MRALAIAAALLLLAPMASAQHSTRAEREAHHRAPTYGEAEHHETGGYHAAPRHHDAPTYGEATAGRTVYRSERIVTRYYDGGEARQHITREAAPQWIRDEARAFRTLPAHRSARRAHLDGATYEDGSRYRGELHRGLPHGHGRMDYADGSSFDGGFRDGAPDGIGTLRTASGDVLTGTFSDGALTSGTADYAAGHRYEGAFLAGRPHGRGVMDYADGATYEGAFQSGRPDGWGTYRTADGQRFEGHWNRGEMRRDERRYDDRRTRRDRRHTERSERRAMRDGAWR